MAKNVLLMSHGITGATGFANQLWLQSRALVEEGYEVLVVHRDYRGEAINIPKGSGVKLNSGKDLDGITILPIGQQQWGEDVIPYYIGKYQVDYVHTLGDIWCYQYLKDVPRRHDWKWMAHYVFDTENMVSFWHDSIKNADISVVPSKNSFEMISHYGHKNIKYIPHGINTEVFKPCTFEEKKEFRNELGIPENAFVIGMVAHNQVRKMTNRILEAFNIFVKEMGNKDAILVMHCLPKDANGWDLLQMIKDRGIGANVLFTDKNAKGFADIMVPEQTMRKLYCSMDIHALSTGGEGFGIPTVEAMSCGIPNITTAYCTGKEFLMEKNADDKLVNERGIAVPYIDIDHHHTGGVWAKIDVPKMAEAFMLLRKNEDMAKQMGMKSRKFVVENYDFEIIKKQWKELYKDFDSFVDGLRMDGIKKHQDSLRAVRVV